jgi:hypothetical protein
MSYSIKTKKLLKFGKLIVSLIFFNVLFLIFYFKITAPEGSAILQHYCFGDGTNMVLESDYFPNSPVIKAELKKMRIGEDKVIRFNQNEDWRLSYALNPFHLVKKTNGFKIYQYVKFDNKGVDVTEINFRLFKIKVKDSWVHVLNPTPFMVVYQYNKK